MSNRRSAFAWGVAGVLLLVGAPELGGRRENWLAGGIASAAERTPVVVLPLAFAGDLVSADRSVLSQRLTLGLQASQLEAISGEAVSKALGGRQGEACDAPCRRDVAASLEARFVVGGQVRGRHDNYELKIWAADGYSGKTLAEVERSCDICGVTELASTMELAASALHVKLRALRKQAARVRITSAPPGATILLDGDAAGRTPQVLDLVPGEHQLVLRADGHAEVSQRVLAVAGVQENVDVELPARGGSRWRRPVGWGAVGVGLALGVVGGVLIGLDGQATECTSGALRLERCRSQRETAAAGGVSVGLGLAAIGVGIYFIITGQPAEQASLAVIPDGSGLRMLGHF